MRTRQFLHSCTCEHAHTVLTCVHGGVCGYSLAHSLCPALPTQCSCSVINTHTLYNLSILLCILYPLHMSLICNISVYVHTYSAYTVYVCMYVSKNPCGSDVLVWVLAPTLSFCAEVGESCTSAPSMVLHCTFAPSPHASQTRPSRHSSRTFTPHTLPRLITHSSPHPSLLTLLPSPLTLLPSFFTFLTSHTASLTLLPSHLTLLSPHPSAVGRSGVPPWPCLSQCHS